MAGGTVSVGVFALVVCLVVVAVAVAAVAQLTFGFTLKGATGSPLRDQRLPPRPDHEAEAGSALDGLVRDGATADDDGIDGTSGSVLVAVSTASSGAPTTASVDLAPDIPGARAPAPATVPEASGEFPEPPRVATLQRSPRRSRLRLRRRRAQPAAQGGLAVSWERARPSLFRRIRSALAAVILLVLIGGLAAGAVGALIGLGALAVRSAVGT